MDLIIKIICNIIKIIFPVSERKRKLSECSNFTDDDDEGGIGSFTSTVCVNFSEDDLRLATIPGQVEVNRNFLLNIVP